MNGATNEIQALHDRSVRYLKRPLQMNLELTGECPLHCPQCYVEADPARCMPPETALHHIAEAATYGVRAVNLSGGETLCYPDLEELIRACASYGLVSAAALSGALAGEAAIRGLLDAGVSQIYISLNGSTGEINRKTRDGYEAAVRALGILRSLREKGILTAQTGINWVMHRTNAEDFPAMIRLAEEYRVDQLVVMGLKPDASGRLHGFPSREQMTAAARQIRSYGGPLEIDVESCFSPLRALLGESLFMGNLNRGIARGCGAGRDGFSVDASGAYTPCRHILLPERYPSLDAYWNDSAVLHKLRSAEDHRCPPCSGCRLQAYCLPCMEIGEKLGGSLLAGFPGCPLAEYGSDRPAGRGGVIASAMDHEAP